jgi:hypothetical protein
MPTAARAMRLFTAQTDEPDLQDLIRNVSTTATDQIYAVLRFARSDLLAFLRSYTNVYRPPRYQHKFRLDAAQRRVAVEPGDRSEFRPAHPGGWADVSYDLMRQYYTQLTWEDGGWKLVVGNRSEHAIYVEAMDGFFVVHGILQKNGPVARSIRRAIKALGFKNWVVTSIADQPDDNPGLNINPKSGQAPAPTYLGEEPNA